MVTAKGGWIKKDQIYPSPLEPVRSIGLGYPGGPGLRAEISGTESKWKYRD